MKASTSIRRKAGSLLAGPPRWGRILPICSAGPEAAVMAGSDRLCGPWQFALLLPEPDQVSFRMASRENAEFQGQNGEISFNSNRNRRIHRSMCYRFIFFHT